MLLALISAGFAGEAGAAAGKVDFATPGVTVAGRDGQQRPLTKGTDLDSGDTVRTTAEGRAQIRFNDGSYVSLQPNTDFSINDYKFEGKDDDRGFFGLVRGAMRTVTGAVGRVNRNSYRITTPTATVGIRGTGGVIQVQNDGSTLVIGTSGIWSLTNVSGSIDIPAGTSGIAPTEPNQPPRETNTQPQTSNPQPVQPQKTEFVQGDQVNPDGTAAISTFVPLVTGTNYTAAVAFPFGATFGFPFGALDGGESGDYSNFNPAPGLAVFNPQGQMTQVTISSTTYKMEPGSSHADFGSDGVLAWGRWIGPVSITGTACEGVTCNENYNENQGFHYVVGVPTAVMPTGGTATYSLLGATRPTYIDGSTSPGAFSGSLKVDFNVNQQGFHTIQGSFAAAMPDRTYNWTSGTSTGSAYFFMGASSVAVEGTLAGCANSSCRVQMTGFFAGTSAERAGAAYRIEDLDAQSVGKSVVGAAAFKKN